MSALGIAHQHVVGLVQNVGAVAVRAVLFEIDILVHVGVHRLDVVFLIRLVEGGKHFGKVTRFHRHLIVQNADGGVAFDLPLKLFHDLFVRERARRPAFSAGGQARTAQQQRKSYAERFSSLHPFPSFSKIL